MTTIDREYVEALLAAANLLDDDGKLNDDGKQVLAVVLTDFLGERHGPAFEPIKKAAGSVVAVEAVIVEDGQVLLEWREHPIFGKGWHTPGTYPHSAEGETFEDAVRRCAFGETGIAVDPIEQLAVKNHLNNPRFPDAPILYLCRVLGGAVKNHNPDGEPKPNDCRWFSKCPSNMLPIQEDYREHIDVLLGN